MSAPLHVERTGRGHDVLLLHGWMMNSRCWDVIVPRLREYCRLTLIDLPGHGGSLRSSYSFEYPEQLLDGLLELAPRRALWMGWSLGGLLAQLAARMRPERISALISVGMGSRYTATRDWPHGVSQLTFRAFQYLFLISPEAIVRQFIDQQVSGSEQQEHARRAIKSLAMMPWNKKELRAGLELLRCADARQAIREFDSPVLFVAGEKDIVVSAQSVKHSSLLASRGSYAGIPGAGHVPFLSHPGEFFGVIRGFIEGTFRS